MSSFSRTTCMACMLCIGIAITPSTVTGQITVPPDLLGQFGGAMSATYNGEWFDASRDYIVLQVIDGGRGENVARLGYYAQREYTCEVQLSLVDALPHAELSRMVLRVNDGETCIAGGTQVKFQEGYSPPGTAKEWMLSWTQDEFSVEMLVTRKYD